MEMERNSHNSLDLFDPEADYSEGYLNSLMTKAATAWTEITDADCWLDQIREGDEGKGE